MREVCSGDFFFRDGFVISRWGILLVVVLIGTIIDQYTKYLANIRLRDRGIVTIIEGFFDLRYSLNPGIFFGIGSEISDSIRNVVLVTVNILAIGLILQLFRKTPPGQRALFWALMLLLSGAFGNLIDRVLKGEVVDFLHLHYRDVFHWATFNLADILIAFGLGLLFLDLFQKRVEASPNIPSSEMR